MENREAAVSKICAILEEKKAEAVERFDLRGSEYFVDFVVLATAFIDRHALALLDELKTQLKPLGEEFLHIEDDNAEWIVADLGDIVVHIFTDAQRKKFNLEEFLSKMAASRG